MNQSETNLRLISFATYPFPTFNSGQSVCEKLQEILSAGADPTVENSYVLDAIANAPRGNGIAHGEVKKLAEILIEAGADPKACPQALVSAIKNNRSDVAYLLITKGADVHAMNDLAMGYAIHTDQTHIINYITDVATKPIDVTPFVIMYCNERDDEEFIDDMLDTVRNEPKLEFDEQQFISFLSPEKAARIQKKIMTHESQPATSRASSRRSLGSL